MGVCYDDEDDIDNVLCDVMCSRRFVSTWDHYWKFSPSQT